MADALVAAQQKPTDASFRTLLGVSAAHWVSHVYMYALAMMFPFLKAELGVSYVELGFALTVSGITTFVTQAPIGYLCDRIGSLKVLLAGLVLGGLALILLGLHLSYPWLIGSAVLIGLANSVYHPADYAILAANIDQARMGRAFSIHTFAGYAGTAVSPFFMAGLTAATGGHGALIVTGMVGPAVALLLVALAIPDARAEVQMVDGKRQAPASILSPALILLTVFFLLLSLSINGINNFGIVALMSGYGAPFSTASIALTAFLTASAIGVLAGGLLADRTRSHGQFAAACFALNAILVLILALASMPPAMLITIMIAAGFLSGVIAPSRDMLVHNAAPPGASGRAFGIVSTGFNLGNILSPVLFGWIMDRQLPHWVFGMSAVFMVVTVVLALITDRHPRRSRHVQT